MTFLGKYTFINACRCVACLESSPDCHRGQTCTWDGRCVFRKGCPQGMGEENCRGEK